MSASPPPYGPAGGQPPGPDDDGMTYLPVDHAHASDPTFGPTDPRAGTPLGGIKIGSRFPFVPDDALPRLAPEAVGQACDQIVRGQGTYAGLLVLGRAVLADLDALWEASQSAEVKVRWERLWVLSPTLARLARTEAGRERLVAHFAEDLGGVHLLSKFIEQNNPSVKKLFKRVQPLLLPLLLGQMAEARADPRRAALISSVIGAIETKEGPLREALPPTLDPETAEEVLGYLYVRRGGAADARLSSAALRERLSRWRRE